MVDLLIDHNVSAQMTPASRRYGHAITEVRQIGSPRAPDDALLFTAAQYGQVFVTYNGGDFKLLHDAWRRWTIAWQVAQHHAGILVLLQPPSLRPMIAAQEVDRFLTSGVSLIDQLYEWDSSAGWVHYLGKRREVHD